MRVGRSFEAGSTKQILLKKLREYPDLKFSSAYPIFSGKKLSQIDESMLDRKSNIGLRNRVVSSIGYKHNIFMILTYLWIHSKEYALSQMRKMLN